MHACSRLRKLCLRLIYRYNGCGLRFELTIYAPTHSTTESMTTITKHANAYPTYTTVVHMLLDAAQRAPNAAALVTANERLNNGDYAHRVAAFASELQAYGAGGNRVALIMKNSTDICIAMFAAHMAGAQVVPLSPQYTASELRPLLQDAAPCVLIHDANSADRDRDLARELNIEHVVTVGGARRLTQPLSGDEFSGDLPRPNDLASLQFTGGTTGRAKGAEITHAALAVNLAQRAAVVPARADRERMLCVMPLFHCYAIHMGLHNMVQCRGCLVIMDSYHPAELLRLIEEQQVTLFGGSPTLFTGLMAFPAFEQVDFSALQASYSGASALPETVLKRWEDATGAPVIEGYGQSEAGSVIAFNPLHGTRKPGSVGIPLPGVELEIVDLDSGKQILPPGVAGEIRVSGPQLMCGYRNRPQETREALRDGWLYTGDIGELDDDGYLTICGRKKEMLIVSGYNVYPREIEDVLMQAPTVDECAVVGIADDHRGELPLAVIVTANPREFDACALAAFCEKYLAPYKRPVRDDAATKNERWQTRSIRAQRARHKLAIVAGGPAGVMCYRFTPNASISASERVPLCERNDISVTGIHQT